MMIDTKEAASTLWKTKAFVIIVYAMLVLVTMVWMRAALMYRMMLCGVLSVAFLVFYWFQYRMEYTYFYFSDSGDVLTVRFYSLRNFYGRPREIAMPRARFSRYEIVTGFFGRKELLVLYQKTPRGEAKYPPVSLSLLSGRQRSELKRHLFSMMH